MIKKLRVDNFKSLNDFEISFTPFTVMVGNNSAGKSTVLQALDFLACSMDEDFDIIIERRGQQVQDIKSRFHGPSNSRIRFSCLIELRVGADIRNLNWGMDIHAYTKNNSLVLAKETVIDMDSGETLLFYETNKEGFVKSKGQKMAIMPVLSYRSSILGLIDEKKNREAYPEVCAFKGHFRRAASFELLSPDKMRLSSRGRTDHIGRFGDKLPSFIKCMDEKKRSDFLDKVNMVLNGKVCSVTAKTQGKPGWTMLEVTERYGDREINVTSRGLSDGMLRLLAFVAISEMEQDHTFMLLDEIENGINANHSEKLIQILGKITEGGSRQLIVTTHSTVFLDYIRPEDIVYLYRDRDGDTKAVPLFKLPTFKRRLDSFYPGEVLLNLSDEEILGEVMGQE